MGIYHDAYLFNLGRFTNLVSRYIQALNTSDGYNKLRLKSLELVRENLKVQELLKEYGGWDEQALLSDFSTTHPYTHQDVGHWITIMLYSTFESGVHELGIGNNWQVVEPIFEILEWRDDISNLLVYGNKFKYLADQILQLNSDHAEYWSYIQPFSTAGSAGWISSKEVHIQLSYLLNLKNSVIDLLYEKQAISRNAAEAAIFSMKEMLYRAKDRDTDLCVILSG